MARRALICGISDQDEAYLTGLLLNNGYEVHGTALDTQIASFSNLRHLGVEERISFHSMALNDFHSVLQVPAKAQPDVIYNLAGQSSVRFSFKQFAETLESISVGVLYLLEAIRLINQPIKFYNARSSECFGNAGGEPADEQPPFRPRSPYAVAKATDFWEVFNYRETYKTLCLHWNPLYP